jgi:hypothetical protein
MEAAMPIDPRIEQSTRTMLGHAMRHELEGLDAVIVAEGDAAVHGVIGLCVVASGYISIDVCEQWPTEVDLREIAASVAKATTRLGIQESDIYGFLSRVALGDEKFEDVYPVPKARVLPVLILANLLATFRPLEKQWWEYLDQIWGATESAERIHIAVLPALMHRAHKETGVTVSAWA